MRETHLAQPSDEELLGRMLSGDAAAFALLYDRRQPGVYRFALRMCGSVTLAEDVTQDVFLSLLRDAHQFNAERGALAGYLFGMARHRLWRLLQRERSFVALEPGEHEEPDWTGDVEAVTENPLRDCERSELAEQVRQAVLALPMHYREVVVLCNLQELSYEQAANVVGCPVGTVRSRLNRARALLIEKLRVLQSGQHNEQQTGLNYELSRV